MEEAPVNISIVDAHNPTFEWIKPTCEENKTHRVFLQTFCCAQGETFILSDIVQNNVNVRSGLKRQDPSDISAKWKFGVNFEYFSLQHNT